MELLKQNSKMLKSSDSKTRIYNFGIPAIKTCPKAGNCKVGCYAKSGTYNFPAVVNAYETRFQITQLDSFVKAMVLEIDKKSKRGPITIRIHDSGDFYNLTYVKKWFTIIECFPEIEFYAYTKQVLLFKRLKIPKNLRLTFSFGGKEDFAIDTDIDRHTKVFKTLEELKASGYVNGTNDDKIAAKGKSNKIGLVYHGNKSWENTLWHLK